jgi:hypothetical protein
VLGTKRTSEPTPNQEGCSYCTRANGLFQGFCKRKGFSVAQMQQTSGSTLWFSRFFENFSNKYNDFRMMLNA